MRRLVFLLAYGCSGLAGLVYEVSWTRLLTLYMGHTTAATSAVVAAFMGGLAGGAVIGGRVAPRLTPRQCLAAYVVLECFVGLAAILLPFELTAVQPLLAWAYRDGASGALFPLVRLLLCLVLMLLPAAALGATFPLAVRWYVSEASRSRGFDGERVGRLGGTLYAINTAGAAIGALAAGFVLIPTIGISGTTWVGVAAGALAVVAVVSLLGGSDSTLGDAVVADSDMPNPKKGARSRSKSAARESDSQPLLTPEKSWLVPAVLGLSGFSSLMFEITWARVLALTLGPTTYAFATTVAALIAGLAVGSAFGAWIAGRSREPALWLVFALTGAAIASSLACGYAGGDVPRLVAQEVASAPDTFARMLRRAAMFAALLIFPTSVGLGAAFPLALANMASSSVPVASRVGIVYAVNTIAAVTGALVAGFVTIPLLGLQQTLRLVTTLLIMASLIIAFWGRLSTRGRSVGFVAAAVSLAVFVWSPPWDRELLASGVYKYSAYVGRDLDLESALTAGSLLYYREGSAATVSVKQLTGTVTMAIDGKVDASNASDMLTQKLIAHLPLLLHENPREVCVIGVGSGVTAGAALRHPIARVDVVEISPEVVEASKFFAVENGNALEDPRTRLIVGDGRSHLALSKRKYDVIISEPSNPWIAGVAALFTREFFLAVRDRLAPGGIVSQWAHTYNISSGDLRSIVATFTSVFPNGTVWMVGQDDVLLIASEDSLDSRMANIERSWERPGVADDLRVVSASDPFAVLSLYAGGPEELKRYSAGARVQTDDRMALEFSGPRDMDNRAASENAAQLSGILDEEGRPEPVQRASAGATAAEWRNRAAMMLKAGVPVQAYQDYLHAIGLDPRDHASLDGLAQTAVLADRLTDALDRIKALSTAHPTVPAIWVAKSKLLAASGAVDEAIDAARTGSEIKPLQPIALEQLAAIFADTQDVSQLDVIVEKLRQTAPERAATFYYAAVAKLLHDDVAEVVRLGEQAKAADPRYGPVYDLLGAAFLKLGQSEKSREAFLASLRLNRHDTTAYVNLGIIELQAGKKADARRYFSEALWLDPNSSVAREGLQQAR